jgi:sulfate/thiosulfate transport system substrate-binding protein
MKTRLWLGAATLGFLSALWGCSGDNGPRPDLEIVNVSYDPTRELYQEINTAFAEHYRAQTGVSVKVTQSHGGSGAQARAVIDGLQADVVSLALAGDIDALARKGLIGQDWEARLPDNAAPYASTIVFVVRRGNPLNIKDWDDLVRPAVKVITPNPKISGGARWNFLAAWGYVTLHKKGSDAEAAEFVKQLYRNVVKLDTGARGSAQSFVKNKLGDVFISWENEAIFIQKEVPEQQLEIVYPSVSIRAEPPVAVVDRNVDARGSRAVAEAYLKFLYTDEAQDIIGRHAYRPSNPDMLKKHAATLPELKQFTIREVAGSWAEAQQRFFADGGVFDEIYRR